MSARPLIAVVGGGISGLVVAWHAATFADVVCFEREARLGGKIQTVRFRDRPLDVGPDAVLTRNPAAIDLCRELGLASHLIEPATRSAGVYARGALRSLPEGQVLGVPTRLSPLARSGAIGLAGTLRAALDLLATRPVLDSNELAAILEGRSDPTVADVLGRRFGRAVLEALIDPLVGGINASDVRQLSMYSAMPQVAERATTHRSLMRALRPVAPRPASSAIPASSGGSVFRGIDEGLGTLPGALADALRARGGSLVLSEVSGIDRDSHGRLTVHSASGAIQPDALVLATPAYDAAALVRALSPALATELSAIPYASVATATFAFPLDAVPATVREVLGRGESGKSANGPLPGSGVLVARRDRVLLTAASFTSSKWPHSANPGEVVIRCSLGRHGDDRATALSDDDLCSGALVDLERVLGISASPLGVEIARFARSFPQYVSGHRERVRRIEALAASLHLELAGAAYHGIGIPSCIASATTVATRLGATLANR